MFDHQFVFWVQSGAVLAVALLLNLLLRRQSALRLAVSRVSLLAIVGLIVVSPYLREKPHPVLPVAWRPMAVSVTTVVANTTREKAPAIASIADEGASNAATTPFDPNDLVTPIWAIGGVLLGLHLLSGYIGLFVIRRRCRVVVDPTLLEPLADTSKAVGVRVPRLLEGEAVGTPFVTGVLRPTVFLPIGWKDGQDEESIRAVLQHEVAHIAGGDLRWALFHRVICIALWPQPLLWLLKRPIASASEELCDRQVIEAGIPAHRYADCLLRLREGLRRRPCPSLGIGAVSSRSSLGKRIEAMFDRRRSGVVRVSRRTQAFTRLGALGIVTLAALLIGRPLQARQDPYAGWLLKPYTGNVNILVDGKPVTHAKAWVIFNGDLPEPLSRPLKVEQGKVEIPHVALPKDTVATLVVSTDGRGLGVTRLWPAPQKVTTLELPRALSYRGRLLLPNGKPAENIPVALQHLTWSGKKPSRMEFAIVSALKDPRFQTVTDKSGWFELKNLPPHLQLNFDVNDLRFAHVRFEDGTARLKDSSVTESTPVRLHRAATISGTILRDGRPVAGIRVGAQGNMTVDSNSIDIWGDTISDASGHYTINRLAAGVCNVSLTLRASLEDEVTSVAHEAVKVKEGSRVEHVDFALIPGAVIEGTVYGEDGQPLVDAPVGVYSPAHPTSSPQVQPCILDGHGGYRARVPAGNLMVYVSDSRWEAAEHPTVKDGTTTRIDLHAKSQPERPVPSASDDATDDTTDNADAKARQALEEAETKPTPSTMSFGKGTPFYGPVKLKSGAILRLAYMQDDSTHGHHLWRPDGSVPLAKDVRSSLGLIQTGHRPVRALFAKVMIDGVSRGSYNCLVQVPQPSSWSVWQSYGEGDNKTVDLATFRAAKTLKVSDMRFGIAAGPYRVISKARLGQGPLYPTPSKSNDAAMPVAKGEGSQSGFAVNVHVPNELKPKDVSLAAISKSGKEFPLRWWNTDGKLDKTSNSIIQSFGFNGGALTDVDYFELRVRDYEWVTFRGIHLYPNK